MKRFQRFLVFTLIASVAWCQQPSGRQGNSNNDSDDLQVVAIQGEDGANIVQDGTFAETIVEVRDRNGLPIAGGALVTVGIVWAVTHSGGGSAGSFANGSNTVTLTADANGRAVISGFRPQGTGQVNVQIQASYRGHTGHITVHQTNFPTVAAARAAGKTPGNQNSSQQSTSQAQNAVHTGMSTGAKVVLVLGGLAVVGAGAAYAAGLFNTNSSSGGSSDACLTGLQANVTALNSFQTTCNQAFSAVNFTGACLTEFQSMANTFSSTCATCNGTSGYSGAVQDWQSDIIDYGSVHGVNETGGSCH